MRYLTALLAVAALFTSCFSDECPVIDCNATLSFKVLSTSDASVAPSVELAGLVQKLDIFMEDDRRQLTYGPFSVDVNQLYKSAVRIEQNGQAYITATALRSLPRGDFKVWAWANVSNPDVYSFDKFTVQQKDDIAANSYMAAASQFVSITQVVMNIDAGELKMLTVPVNIDYTGVTASEPTALLFSSVGKSVNADGEYGSVSTLEYRQAVGALPQLIYLFPNQVGGDATYTFKSSGVQGSVTESLPTLQLYNPVNLKFTQN